MSGTFGAIGIFNWLFLDGCCLYPVLLKVFLLIFLDDHRKESTFKFHSALIIYSSRIFLMKHLMYTVDHHLFHPSASGHSY